MSLKELTCEAIRKLCRLAQRKDNKSFKLYQTSRSCIHVTYLTEVLLKLLGELY